MGSFGLSFELDVKTPEKARERLVELLLDPTFEMAPEVRQDLAKMLQDGFNGFRLDVARTKRSRPSTSVLRNVSIYEAINRARYRLRVGDDTTQPSMWRETIDLPEAEWAEIVDRVIADHNASCEPDDRWLGLHNQSAREKAFDRGCEAMMEYRKAQELEE
jgi:hypothetical protein